MLYIFDLGNVVIDIDFNRVLGVWSKLSGVPFATLKERFTMDEEFGALLSQEIGMLPELRAVYGGLAESVK